MISVLPASARLGRISVSGEGLVDSGMRMRVSQTRGCSVSRGMLKVYKGNAWKRFSDTGEDLAGLLTLDEQDAFMAEEKENVAAELAVAAVPAVDVDVLLAVNKDDEWELESAVHLDELERVGIKRKLRELQEKSRQEAKGFNICRRGVYAGQRATWKR